MDKPVRVLSIQSHVVFGYVGNKAATFPLQLLGFDVDALNTVNFSNHTDYTHVTGSRLTGEELQNTLKGVFLNNLASYSYLLTGYLGTASLVEATGEIIRKVKASCPGVIYVLDPVMGDNGKLYVSSEVVPLYKDVVCPLADIITPNQTEAELLTGISILSVVDLAKVFSSFHKMGIKNVIITSCSIQPSSLGDRKGCEAISFLYASQLVENASVPFFVSYPQKDYRFVGTGDLLAALILAWYQRSTTNLVSDKASSPLGHLATACQIAISTIQKVLENTLLSIAQSSKENLPEQQEKNYRAMISELRLVGSRGDILSPVIKYLAQPLV